jgi:hypothetical protein
MNTDTIANAIEIVLGLKLPFHAFLGAFTLYVLNRLQGKHPFSLFQALNIDVTDSGARPHTIFADMVLSSALGAAVVIPLTSPTTTPQAIIAGLGMTGILAAHVRKDEKDE